MALPAGYVGLYNILAETAKEHGYAMAIHESLKTDIDLMCVPWTQEAVAASDLMAKLEGAITFLRVDAPMDNVIQDMLSKSRVYGPERKPHGRLAWTIQLSGGCLLAISVMPRVLLETQRHEKRQGRVERNAEIYANYISGDETIKALAYRMDLSVCTVTDIIRSLQSLRSKKDIRAKRWYVLENRQPQRHHRLKRYLTVKSDQAPDHALMTLDEAQRLADVKNAEPTMG